MRRLLEEPKTWPNVDLEQLRQQPDWLQARAWGRWMESGELTGIGLRDAGEPSRGLVSE